MTRENDDTCTAHASFRTRTIHFTAAGQASGAMK